MIITKSTGMIRPVDKMGRVVIPKEIRAQMNVQNDVDSFEIFTEGDMVILKKYRPSCVFCDSIIDNVEFEGFSVCKSCIEKLGNIAEEKIEEE